MLMKTAAQSLSEQLAARFAQRIRDRLLAADARLPSARSCAQQQRVSPFTVVVAYDRLVAQGLVEARKGRSLHVRYMPVAQMEYVHTAIDSVANGKWQIAVGCNWLAVAAPPGAAECYGADSRHVPWHQR